MDRSLLIRELGGAREAIVEGETGYLVQVGDDATMAERIVSLLKEPARAQEMGQRGRRVVEQKFSCEAQLARTENLYERLLERASTNLAREVEEMRQENA